MNDENVGYEKSKTTAENLKQEKKEEKEKSQIEFKEELVALSILKENTELAKLYSENANLGTEYLSQELPLLKIHATGRSMNELSNGKEPNDGWFFYIPEKEQYEKITCHILTISRGFRTEGYQGKKDVYTQILGGLFFTNNGLKPFIMFLTGTKLQNIWEFGKEIKKYTKAKPIPIPMFTMIVEMTSEKITHANGKSWVPKFSVQKDTSGNPDIVVDSELFNFLKTSVVKTEEMIESVIINKTKDQEEKVDILETEEIPFP